MDDTRARVTEALNTAPAAFVRQSPDSLTFHQVQEWSRHDQHRYLATCAMCRGETDTLTDAVLAVLSDGDGEAVRLSHDYRTRYESLRARLAGIADAWRLLDHQNINTATVVETIDNILEAHRESS